MFSVGERMIYGHVGVCTVKSVEVPSFCARGEEKPYYVLEPMEQGGQIFIPVDSQVFMRPVLKREEAERLIDMIPSLRGEAFHGSSTQETVQHYSEAIRSHDCEDLIELIMSIYAKKEYRRQNNLKFGSVDEGFMRRAESLLYGEFSVALDMDKDQVADYIARRVKALEKGKGKPSAQTRGE